MIFVGIDPGINASAVVAIENGKVVGEQLVLDIVKGPKQKRFELNRVRTMATQVSCAIYEIWSKSPSTSLHIVIAIEEPFVGANASGALKQYSVFVALALMDSPRSPDALYFVAPTTLKKFVGAKGKKNLIAREVYKRWKYEADDDNLVDAYAIARWAEATWNEQQM